MKLPLVGSRFWLISKIWRVLGETAADTPFSMKHLDGAGGIAVDVELGKIGALQISARNVHVLRIGDANCLGVIVDAARRHLNLMPARELQKKPVPIPQEAHLFLFESEDDVATFRRQSEPVRDLRIVMQPACKTLAKPHAIEKIANALVRRKIGKCVLILPANGVADRALAEQWQKLENAVGGTGVLEIAIPVKGGRLRLVKSNAERLSKLDRSLNSGSSVPKYTDGGEADPDPW